MKKMVILLIALMVIGVGFLCGCNNQSITGNDASSFIGTWKPDQVLMGASGYEETWEFKSNGDVEIIVYEGSQPLTPDVLNWETKDNILYVKLPEGSDIPAGSIPSINGSYQFTNNGNSFTWTISNLNNAVVVFNKI